LIPRYERLDGRGIYGAYSSFSFKVAAKIHARIGNKHVHTHAVSRFGAPSTAAMWGIENIFNHFHTDNQQLR
jgi:hypothetical protein